MRASSQASAAAATTRGRLLIGLREDANECFRILRLRAEKFLSAAIVEKLYMQGKKS